MTVPRFWREIPARYNLIGTKCSHCGEVFFPPREVCPSCKSIEMEKFKLKGTGEILSYTVIRVPPAGFEGQVPYVIAIIKMDEGPKLTAQIVDCDPSQVEIGKRVKVCFRRISEDGRAGIIYYGYKFVLDE